MSLLHRLGKEASKVALATLHFFFAFLILLTFKMLFLAEYGIDSNALLKATLGALVVGKVVVVLSATSFGRRFRRRMVALDILYQSLLYTAAVALVVVGERLVDGYMETKTSTGAWEHAMNSANLMRALANVMGIYLSFVAYVTLAALARHFGRDRVLRFLFTREGAIESEADAR